MKLKSLIMGVMLFSLTLALGYDSKGSPTEKVKKETVSSSSTVVTLSMIAPAIIDVAPLVVASFDSVTISKTDSQNSTSFMDTGTPPYRSDHYRSIREIERPTEQYSNKESYSRSRFRDDNNPPLKNNAKNYDIGYVKTSRYFKYNIVA